MKTTLISSSLIIFLLLNGSTVSGNQSARKNKNKGTNVKITAADIAMAKEVIQSNTRTIPGFTPHRRTKLTSGNFSAADALVLYLFKFHRQTKICPPVEVVVEALKKLNDADVHKKAVAIFWLEYSTCSDLNDNLTDPEGLKSDFDWYILTKQTERIKIVNFRLRGFIGADEAWRKAMNSQQKFWEKSQNRENEYILTRDAYRAIFDAQAAVAAAERAIAGGY